MGGAAGTRILKQFPGQPSALTRLIAHLWPWPLAILVTWLVAQFPVGALFNDFLKSIIGAGLLLIVVMVPLSVCCAYAHDAAIAG